jgi:Fic family protein
MKIPEKAPDYNKIIAKMFDEKKTLALFSGTSTDEKGRYLHWDKLKHLNPPEGYTSEEWWTSIKFSRQQISKPLNLLDKNGVPFSLLTTDFMSRELHWLDKNTAGSLFADTPILDSQLKNTYLIRSLIEEAISSSQVEGAATTRKVAKEMILQGREPVDKDEQMILNNFIAMQFVRDYKEEPLTNSMILELHKILTIKTLDNPKSSGCYRTLEDDIHVVNGQGEILFTPPKADELPVRMDLLCRFANDLESETFMHPVIRAILIHFMLAYNHPFVDGNGRTARALFYWSMAKQGYWLMEFVAISRIIKRAIVKYGTAFLHTETDGNDTTYFIIHQLEVIRKAIEEFQAFLKKKTLDQKEAQELLEGSEKLRSKLNYRQLALLRHAVKKPGSVYKIHEHQQLHGIAYETARNDFIKMSDNLKILDKLKQGKSFVFVSPEDILKRIEQAKKIVERK